MFHMLPESRSKEAGTRKQHDMQALGELFGYLGVGVRVDRVLLLRMLQQQDLFWWGSRGKKTCR